MDKLAIVTEEKEYWQKEALKARAMNEEMAASLRTANEDGDRNGEIQRRHYRRDEAVQKLVKALAAEAGIALPPHHLALATPEFVEKMVEDVKRVIEDRKADEAPQDEYLLVAWQNQTNGSLYLDARKLSIKDKEKMARLRGVSKVALYAKVPK